jgi:tRNA-modifying protein YgfZ
MQESCYFDLSNYGLMQLKGTQAVQLMHNMTTADFNLIDQSTAIFTALCQPNGKVTSSGWCFFIGQDLHWLIPNTMVQSTIKSITPYAMLSKVSCTHQPDWSIYGLLVESPIHSVNQSPEHIQISITPRHAVRLQKQAITANKDQAHWCHELHTENLALIHPQTQASFTPIQLNYGNWSAISLTKGCYLGQEIVNRLVTKGRQSHQLIYAQIADIHIEPNDPLHYQGKVMGSIISVGRYNQQQSLLASVHHKVCHLDQLTMNDQPLHAIRSVALHQHR